MATDTAERPGVEEQYQTAGNTSDLTVEADRRGAADVVIAAGWSPSRVGMALLRLHSEWDSAAKPKRPSAATVTALAARLRAEDDRSGGRAASVVQRAQVEANRWFANELRVLAVSLRSRAVVWEQLSYWMDRKGVGSEIVARALLHWLSPTCPRCDGHGFLRVPNQPALSNRRCSDDRCIGGTLRPPLGTGPVLAYIEDCVQKARQSLKYRLRRD